MIEEVAVIAFAAWRLASLVTSESGPWQIFRRIREVVGVRHDASGAPSEWPATPLAELLACPWCAGIWTAAAMWGLWQWRWEPVGIIAASAAVPIIERWVRHG